MVWPFRGSRISGPGRGLRLPCVMAVALLLTARTAAPQFTSYSRDARHILEGNWQSCRDASGHYAERIYDHVVNGTGRFEVHLGPRDEFAMFMGVQDEHRNHASPDNLLQPWRVQSEGGRAKRRWDLTTLGLTFTVTLAGGSSDDCESWFVLLEPLANPAH
jgi:hypothetical protein